MENNIYKCLDILIKTSRQQQVKRFELHRSQYNIANKSSAKLSFLKEFSTIRIGCHRQAGHTSSIIDMIKNNDVSPICFFQSIDLIKNFLSQCDEQGLNSEELANQCKIFSNILESITFNKPFIDIKNAEPLTFYNAVIVDNASFLSREKELLLYRIISNYNFSIPFYIIFLQ